MYPKRTHERTNHATSPPSPRPRHHQGPGFHDKNRRGEGADDVKCYIAPLIPILRYLDS
jgi:hypothetical protein